MPDGTQAGTASPPTASVSQDARTKSVVRAGPQLISDLPVAEKAAAQTYEELAECVYQTKNMGRTRGHDDLTCECTSKHGIEYACTDEGGCINRLTQIECTSDTCKSGVLCQNQRFQKKAYARVEIVDTGKKGFGLRAKEDIAADAFVYEYIGEVIHHDTFVRRMEQYKQERIMHFYFMMLQRDEYLDATKKGARSRFINHSCSPNCYVSKWHVGKHVRMGIFAKRAIQQDEELTFNYNVDRYGNDPQECYCGEPNCVGTLGGRIQTDLVTMDDLFIEALGIADEVAVWRASLPRNKKSAILDEDFQPVLHPMHEAECARVMTAVRQATSRRHILHKLLARIAMTDAVGVQKSCVKLHGFMVMAEVLDEWADDADIVGLSLQCLAKWPLLARDKVVDSGVEMQVYRFLEHAPGAHKEEMQTLAKSLVDAWSKLSSTVRIARREQDTKDQTESVGPIRSLAARWRTEAQIVPEETVPASLSSQLRESIVAYRTADENVVHKPVDSAPVQRPRSPKTTAPKESISEIIRRANEASEQKQRAALEEQAAAQAKADAEAKQEEEKAEQRRRRRSQQHAYPEKRARQPEVDMEALEHQLQKLVGALVVKQMSKAKDVLDRERFKRHAKELTRVLCDKEKRNPKAWPPRTKDGPVTSLATLSEEKRVKMKLFAHNYIKKLVQRKKDSPSASQDTPGEVSIALSLDDSMMENGDISVDYDP
ncbi:[histone H3]-lysine(4) N-trimethyltransferase [Malassezia vespertilionis]|uniref:[histone H3]-lysine(4) N-trimethyltransferase n=1 Tax=Malassezia vespertilionis TaxID=2020962 RepID=UPI0024B22321|nr:[histone H3]-lysine(4) N-trimethyltransferase [Malassezia vespertilionis]WFD07088.1 [histone H3]-lysine(4) N-trimethyltransferase [Malassezia vespertilionis]